DERIHDGAECRANDYADREIDDIAAQCEFFKVLKHAGPPFKNHILHGFSPGGEAVENSTRKAAFGNLQTAGTTEPLYNLEDPPIWRVFCSGTHPVMLRRPRPNLTSPELRDSAEMVPKDFVSNCRRRPGNRACR